MATDHEFLLDLLNTTPVIDERDTDVLGTLASAKAWAVEHGGAGTTGEIRDLRAVRDVLQSVVRGQQRAASLQPFLTDVTQTPVVTDAGITWTSHPGRGRGQSLRAITAWSDLQQRSPGRLRACANGECHLFLLDRSKGNSARWCSMATCGNRLKARRHYSRVQGEVGSAAPIDVDGTSI